jgi:hypothetical protein
LGCFIHFGPSYARHARNSRSAIQLLLVAAVSAGVALMSLSSTAASTAALQASAPTRSPVAVAAQSLVLHETANLHLLSRHNGVIIEEGSSTGALDGRMWVRLTVAVTVATVVFTASPAGGGTIHGEGEASYYSSGPTAHFSGIGKITHGTGRYAHVSGSNLQVAGVITRKDYALSVHMSGRIRY